MVGSLQQLFTLICTFYIGSIAEPARETLGAQLADARARGSYMGFSRLGLAFGGALGYAGGGWLFDAGKAFNQPELPWMMLALIGLITFFALLWQFGLKRLQQRMLEPVRLIILQAEAPASAGAFSFFRWSFARRVTHATPEDWKHQDHVEEHMKKIILPLH